MRTRRAGSRGIFGRLGGRAIGAALLVAGCGGAKPAPAAPKPNPTTGNPDRSYPLSGVYLLGASGVPAADTTLRLGRGESRVVVLRHGPPDNLTFAELFFPADAFTGTGDSVRVTIRPRPGIYGIDLETEAPLVSARLRFKYAVHFVAPADARRRYGSETAFEQALAIGQVRHDDTVVFLISSRPGPDNLEAALPGAGRYVVGAPK